VTGKYPKDSTNSRPTKRASRRGLLLPTIDPHVQRQLEDREPGSRDVETLEPDLTDRHARRRLTTSITSVS
jgi:hypothetical protein